MTNSPFSDSRLKVARARQHLAELQANTDSYFSGPWYTLEYGGDPEDIKGIHLTMHGQPKDYSVIFGDIMHNLRAALDLMAVKVVAANNGNTKSVYFPFCENPGDLDRMIARRNFNRASPEAVEEMKRLAPYTGGNIALRALHDFDVQDKHHSLVPNLVTMSTPPIGPVLDENGHPVGFAEGKLKLRIDLSVKPTAVFTFPADSALAGQPIVPTLHELVETVSGILDTFEAIVTK